MSVMASAATTPFTTSDLDAIPEDGRRYELIDGTLHVTPAPIWTHQEVVGKLYRILCAACPDDLRVVIAPFDVRPDDHNDVQPDVLVARYSDLAPQQRPMKNLQTAPLLAAEVLSPSTQLSDRTLKRGFYARLGVRSYWLVDPDPELPALTAFVLERDDYREVRTVVGDEAFEAAEPFPVTVIPSDLVRGLRP